jgi:methyl-accepting chemotaxis protein
MLINELFFRFDYVTTVTILVVIFSLLYASRQARKKDLAFTNHQLEMVELDNEIAKMLESVTCAIEFEVSVINAEINRNNEIVKDAIEGISNSFKSLESLSNEQRQMMKELNEQSILIAKSGSTIESLGGSTNEGNSIKLSQISNQLDEAVSTGIRSLQFEDLTSQILNSIKNNTQTLVDISNEIALVHKVKGPIDISLIIKLKSKCQEIYKQSNQRNEEIKSVNQTSMDEGDIELF